MQRYIHTYEDTDCDTGYSFQNEKYLYLNIEEQEQDLSNLKRCCTVVNATFVAKPIHVKHIHFIACNFVGCIEAIEFESCTFTKCNFN